MKICLILMVSLDLAAGVYQILKFKRSPHGASIEDIGCALERYDAEFTRGVAVDARTKACDSLPESWFSNQTYEENLVYFNLYLKEKVFEPIRFSKSEKKNVFWSAVSLNTYYGCVHDTTKAVAWCVPTNTFIGSTMTAYIRTGQVFWGGSFTINLESEDSTVKCLHMNARFWQYRVVFNSFRGGWGYEMIKPNPFTESYWTYKIEFRITEEAIEVFIDDVLFLNYQHRIPISECWKVMYESDVVDCHRLQYYYPI